jgi:hypothetical protein
MGNPLFFNILGEWVYQIVYKYIQYVTAIEEEEPTRGKIAIRGCTEIFFQAKKFGIEQVRLTS